MATRRLRYADPLRYPENAAEPVRNRRAWTLLAATTLIPGSVQSLVGARRPARWALTITLITWAVVILSVLAVLIHRPLAYTIGTNPIVLTVLTIWAAIATVTWVLCFLDTIRLIKLVSLGPRARTPFIAAALVVVLVIGGVMSYGTLLLNSQRGLITGIFAGGLAVKPTDGRYNIALLGSDAGKGRTGIRPDSMSVVSIDAATGKSVIIGLPRNMQNVPFVKGSPLAKHYPQGYNCGNECLLNAVYQQGEQHAKEFKDPKLAGPQATMDALEGVTGLDIHYYAMIDLKGFSQLIDAMGGITVVSGKRVPISSKVNPRTGKHGPVKGWIEPGKQHLDGYHALWFARSREFASDYERMIRQRCVQEAMLSQMDPATVLVRYQAIAKAAPEVVSTNIPQLAVDRFVDLAVKAKASKVESLNLTPPAVNPTHPDFTAVRQLVKDKIAASQKSQAAAPQPLPAGIYAAGADTPPATDVVSAGSGAQASAAKGSGAKARAAKERAICYVP